VALHSSKTLVHTRATWRNIPGDGILHWLCCCGCQENIRCSKSVFYIACYANMLKVGQNPVQRFMVTLHLSKSVTESTESRRDLLASCFILVSSLAYSLTLKMEATCSSEKSIYFPHSMLYPQSFQYRIHSAITPCMCHKSHVHYKMSFLKDQIQLA
jgi:hypothetical protein